MLLPTKIDSKNKIRDMHIVRLYASGDMTMKEIGVRHKISRVRIGQILLNNRDLLKLDQGFEKMRRVNWLKRHIDTAKPTRKDPADLMEQLRKEIEGNEPPVKVITQIVLTQLHDLAGSNGQSKREGDNGKQVELVTRSGLSVIE